ncbi:ROK family protein [Streptomyces sp. NPDC057137]|uniref:ROK family protein n=1 Tax=Streptomyces sp. NPDC057137 TaxID=3346030 RepID=UPI00362C55FB
MSDTRPSDTRPSDTRPGDGALSPELRAVLRRWADEGGPLATRAGVVLLAADGLRDAEISRRLGVSRQTVGSWRQRWTSAGIDGLEHRPRTGRPATVDEAEVVTRTLLAPGGSGASRAVARELGLSHATVAGIRRRWRLVPDEPVSPSVPTRPPLPGADVWVMGLYADALRGVLLAGTRLVPSTPARAGTVIGADVLAGLDRSLDAALASTRRRGPGPTGDPDPGPPTGPGPGAGRVHRSGSGASAETEQAASPTPDGSTGDDGRPAAVVPGSATRPGGHAGTGAGRPGADAERDAASSTCGDSTTDPAEGSAGVTAPGGPCRNPAHGVGTSGASGADPGQRPSTATGPADGSGSGSTARPGAGTGNWPPGPDSPHRPDVIASDRALAGYLAQASRRHPDLALHAITLWDDAPGSDPAPATEVFQPPGATGKMTRHHIPARATWRTFLRAMIALDSTSHPESSRRVYLDLAAELERYAAGRADDPYRGVRWLRENVAGHLRAEHPTDSSARGHTWSGVNQIDLGSFNECVVIETVRLSGTITRGEIAHRTGLTQQSVSRIARSLLDRGILIEDAQLRATSGKPRTPVRLRGAAAHALGIHIDPELLTAVVIDLDGAIVCTRTRSVSADTDPAEFVERVAALGRETLAEAGGDVRPEGFLGIGVAVPGPVDIASGTVLGPPLMSAWGDLPLLYLLKDHFPCPVIMEKDSTAAAAGERWIGRDRRARDFAYLYLGTGVGTGLYLNGDIYRGVSSNAGEFGQLCAIALGRVDKDGRPEILPECNPPVSVPDLAARGGLRPVPTTSGSTAAYLAVGRAAAAGDRAAAAAVREVAQAVGRGALGLIDLLDIDLIVLGGPFFTDDVADFYLAEIARTVNEFPTARRLRRVEVEPSVLSAGAAAVGAASTIFHATFTPRLRGRETRARHLPAG